MRTNKLQELSKTKEPINRKARHALDLLKPNSECSTTDLIINFPDSITGLMHGMKRKCKASSDKDSEAA
ncbi:MAG: hypothetical protein NVSMB56_01790 [Pyrinomonadaceae bacterium]